MCFTKLLDDEECLLSSSSFYKIKSIGLLFNSKIKSLFFIGSKYRVITAKQTAYSKCLYSYSQLVASNLVHYNCMYLNFCFLFKNLQLKFAELLAQQIAKGGVIGYGDSGPAPLTITTPEDDLVSTCFSWPYVMVSVHSDFIQRDCNLTNVFGYMI